jgi:hypothetical protein
MLQKKSAVMMSLVLIFSVMLACFAYVFGKSQWLYLLLLAGFGFYCADSSTAKSGRSTGTTII